MKLNSETIVTGVVTAILTAVFMTAIGAIWTTTTNGGLVKALGGVTRAEIGQGDDELSGYGNAAHSHTTTRADCPAGMYARGVVVTYGGTCLTQCDQDGGIIRNIELVCRPIVK